MPEETKAPEKAKEAKMPKGIDAWLKQIEKEAKESAGRLGATGEHARLRSAEILNAAAAVSVMELAGENTTTARLALDSSTKSLSREAIATATKEGRELALRAAWSLIRTLVKV